MKYLFVSVSVLTLIMVTGCNSGSTDVNGAGLYAGSWVVPGIGTQFIDHSLFTNSSQKYDTVSVVWRGSLDGKANVVGLIMGDNSSSDTLFLSYQANGDLLSSTRNRSDSLGMAWQRLPTGGGTQIDSSVSFLDSGRTVYYSISTFAGVEQITVPAGTFTAIKIVDSDRTLDMIGHRVTRDTTYAGYTYWFVPSVGWLGKSKSAAGTNGEELYKYQLR